MFLLLTDRVAKKLPLHLMSLEICPCPSNIALATVPIPWDHLCDVRVPFRFYWPWAPALHTWEVWCGFQRRVRCFVSFLPQDSFPFTFCPVLNLVLCIKSEAFQCPHGYWWLLIEELAINNGPPPNYFSEVADIALKTRLLRSWPVKQIMS